MQKEPLTFKEFCFKYCDTLYNPNLPDNAQCTGFNLLRKMVLENITPASAKECEEWEKSRDNIFETPELKYLRFLHPNLRPFIREQWDKIKKMDVVFSDIEKELGL